MPLTATTSTWTWAAGVSAGDLARYFPCYRTLESALLQPIQDRSDLVALHQGRRMSTLRKFKDPGARPPPLHLARSLCGQELRAAAAQYENRLCYRLPIAPEIHVTAERACKAAPEDRKSTRLNSSHVKISYAVFCLKKKQQRKPTTTSPEWTP